MWWATRPRRLPAFSIERVPISCADSVPAVGSTTFALR